METVNNNQQTSHKDNDDICQNNITDSYKEDTSDVESLASTLTAPGMERNTTLEIPIDDSEEELELIDTCTCIDCWTVYPKNERSPSARGFHDLENINDNAYNNVFEWLTQVEQHNQKTNEDSTDFSPFKRKFEETETESIETEQQNSAKYRCGDDQSRSDCSFQYQIA